MTARLPRLGALEEALIIHDVPPPVFSPLPAARYARLL